MSLIIRDLKNNIKPLLYWILGVGILIAILVVAYPAAVEKMDNLGDVINSMPKEIISAFGLENYAWEEVLNYLAYEFQYIFLATAIFAATLGASIFSKEESNKTIELIYSKPVTRNDIFFSKLLVAVIVLVVFNLILFAFTSISLVTLVKDQTIHIGKVFNIYTAMFLVQLIFMSLGMFVAVIMKKSKGSSALTSGIVVFSYMIGIFSKITEELKNLIYISPLHYFLPDQIVRTGEFSGKYLIISLCIIVISLLVSWKVYQRKDFNI